MDAARNGQTRIEVRRLADLSDAEHGQIVRLRGVIDFGIPPHVWTPQSERGNRVLVWAQDTLVCHVSYFVREIDAGGRPVRVGGIGSVMTDPEWRGRGLASTAMRRAAEYMRETTDADFGMLLCLESRRSFYAGLGWHQVGPTTFDQPTGRVTTSLVTMALPLRDAPWPGGPIDMRGLPW